MSHAPSTNLAHLVRLTDCTGLIQHATYGVANYDEGYALDDNARGLMLAALLGDVDPDHDPVPALAHTYLAFTAHAFNRGTGRFRNFMSYDRRWLEDVGSEDSHGRAIHALGTFAARWPHDHDRACAQDIVTDALPAVRRFTSPRAWSFTILGLHEIHDAGRDTVAMEIVSELADRLLALYSNTAGPEWRWYEDVLAYANARLPDALLAAGDMLGSTRMIDVAIESLHWLVNIQKAPERHFRPIGSNGFYRRGGERAVFDQQPIEAYVTVSACLRAWRATGASSWRDEASLAFEWFGGRNDIGRPVADERTGACHDGLEPDGLNANQGAESTLVFQLATAEFALACGSDPRRSSQPVSVDEESGDESDR